jgi:hypothetical protein
MINSQQQVSGATTTNTPAAITNGGNYLLAWSDDGGGIWWAQCPANAGQSSFAWGNHVQIPNAVTSGAPTLASLKGTVWLAWKGEKTDTRIFLSSLSGSTWAPGVAISGIGTNSTPALASNGSELFLTWKGENDTTIYFSRSSDGKNWSPQKPVSGALSTDSPALAGYNGTFYLAWKGGGQNDTSLWWTTWTDANGWAKSLALSSDFGTSSGPALGIGDTGNVHIVWKGEKDTSIWRSELPSGGSSWSPQQKILTIETDTQPALASQPSSATEIVLVWKGGSTTDIWAAPLDNLPGALPLSAGSQPQASGPMTWSVPVTGFGSGPNRANFSATLVLYPDGKVNFSGEYTDSGTVPVFDAPPQNYSVVIALALSNKQCLTFSNSSKNPVPTGGTVNNWNVNQTDARVQEYWSYLPTAKGTCSATNNSDLGSLLDSIVQDLEKLVGYALEVISIVASLS